MAEALIGLLSEVIKAFLPGTALFLLVCVTIGVVLLLSGRSRQRRTAVAWLAGLAIFYWILSLPIVPRTIDGWLAGGSGPLASAAEAEGAQHVVVLGGGYAALRGPEGELDLPSTATGFRLLEAERLYRLLDEPILILSGGPAGLNADGTPEGESMRATLVARGVPESRIWVEAESSDTHEQAVRVGDLLRQRGVETFILVTSPSHMRRALGAFSAEGMHPVASVASAAPAPPGASPFLPSAAGLTESELIFREVFALAYYSLRGWLG